MNVAALAAKTPMAMGALAAIVLSFGGPTPAAHADPTGDFLAQARGQGIGIGRPDAALIEDAQEVCAMLDYQEQAYTYLNQRAGLDRAHAALFLQDSVQFYCPQFAPKLGPQ
ncbi:hypothetical protein MRAB57_4242 [Mycobacterium rhizamassiliense]|jgi:hypothetical protein|uniref:DUF732 domain-containing protein n=1 Tax=Mycobacterium rhizamassiliense TaxID=1841860 RepID=A0A2U3NY16_9MYCO|nr:DUF732 domain-containing protein [Mycobacterium rhizamassiliense]SPM36401.1 hypothetical protein MRAB57_4242 [Mycobacterium rhizamassiliense]